MYRVTKKLDHNLGYSATFRQHAAGMSHCAKLHGYALAFEMTFEAEHLDDRNWVIDYGNFGEIKTHLGKLFDHTTVIAEDDPLISTFRELDAMGLIDLRILPKVGCEAFAYQVSLIILNWLAGIQLTDRVTLVSVTVSEHAANSATYYPSRP